MNPKLRYEKSTHKKGSIYELDNNPNIFLEYFGIDQITRLIYKYHLVVNDNVENKYVMISDIISSMSGDVTGSPSHDIDETIEMINKFVDINNNEWVLYNEQLQSL